MNLTLRSIIVSIILPLVLKATPISLSCIPTYPADAGQLGAFRMAWSLDRTLVITNNPYCMEPGCPQLTLQTLDYRNTHSMFYVPQVFEADMSFQIATAKEFITASCFQPSTDGGVELFPCNNPNQQGAQSFKFSCQSCNDDSAQFATSCLITTGDLCLSRGAGQELIFSPCLPISPVTSGQLFNLIA